MTDRVLWLYTHVSMNVHHGGPCGLWSEPITKIFDTRNSAIEAASEHLKDWNEPIRILVLKSLMSEGWYYGDDKEYPHCDFIQKVIHKI